MPEATISATTMVIAARGTPVQIAIRAPPGGLTNVNVQALTVEAVLERRRDHVYHAAMLDPHTAAELDLDETIDETCRNAGEIEMVFRAPRRNNVRVVLLMDVGGTMDPYYEPVSRLLTALHEDHGLREFQPYYFHNCIYDHVYTKARMMRADAVPTGDVLRKLDNRWKCVIVADGRDRGLLQLLRLAAAFLNGTTCAPSELRASSRSSSRGWAGR